MLFGNSCLTDTAFQHSWKIITFSKTWSRRYGGMRLWAKRLQDRNPTQMEQNTNELQGKKNKETVSGKRRDPRFQYEKRSRKCVCVCVRLCKLRTGLSFRQITNFYFFHIINIRNSKETKNTTV